MACSVPAGARRLLATTGSLPAPTNPAVSQVKYPGGAFVATYLKYMIPGIPLLILYAAVIPAFWFAAVYLNRGKLDVSLALWAAAGAGGSRWCRGADAGSRGQLRVQGGGSCGCRGRQLLAQGAAA